MKIAINADSAQMGGAVTYLRNVLPALATRVNVGAGGRVLVWASKSALPDMRLEGVERREITGAESTQGSVGIARRLWFEQWELPRQLRSERADALFSSANFATLRSPIRQVLLVRNPIYFDATLMGRIRSSKLKARYLGQRALTLLSVRAADVVLFPTQAMLDMVAPYAGGPKSNWRVAPYGARHDLFRPSETRDRRGGPRTILHVSHYCEQKNMGTLMKAMELLEARMPGRHRLRVTAAFSEVQAGPAHPNLEADRKAFLDLERGNIAEDVQSRQYGSLPELYRSADVFAFPSYTESFGHPLVEAMASGLPVVTADVPVNREMCGDAAIYFPPFDASAFAEALARVATDHALAERLRQNGLVRAQTFTWDGHADALVAALRGSP
jgi:glycosyltransferase involved in cell wall biosynthesis